MLIDSNLLVYALDLDSSKSKTAQAFISSHSIVLAQQNIFETLRVLTHSKYSKPFSSRAAIKTLRKLSEGATIITPKNNTLDIAFELIAKYKIEGTEIFDAYLVATALSNGIKQIATDNTKHLSKYKQIQIVNPFD